VLQQYSSHRVVDMTVRQVCGPCNSGWMADLEAEVQGLLSLMIVGLRTAGVRFQLGSDAQRAIARWACLKAVLTQYTLAPPRPADPEYLQWLQQQLVPPPNTVIWLARCAGNGDLRSMSFIGPEGQVSPTHGYVFTQRIGELALQVAMVHRHDGSIRQIPVRQFGNLLQVWPNEGVALRWPPRGVLDEAHFKMLMDRWGAA
jgi:hypothetical protein